MRLKSYFWLVFGLIMALLAACNGDAVVFAPTPPPEDQAPIRYDHPSGAFTVSVPRHWALYEQNTTTLATAAFAAPGSDEPAILFAVINLGREVSSTEFGDLLNLYQSQVRSDVGRYTEQSRQAMGDGSWRLTGLRQVAQGTTQAVNTFIQNAGTFIGVTEIVLPSGDPSLLQTIANTFTIHPDAPIQPADLTTLAFAKNSGLGILHVSAWTTSEGVFFITGEVANYSFDTVRSIPIEAALTSADGLDLTGAVDLVMGHGIPPGGFAPFSLRFGGGQPTQATDYTVRLGKDWIPIPSDGMIYGTDSLSWTDESTFDSFNRLLIRGQVTNFSDHVVRQPRAAVTVFDSAQNVIGAGYIDITPTALEPGSITPFEIPLQEVGGDPVNYIVNIQGLP